MNSVSASSLNIGSILGCFLGGYFGGKYGPKRAIQCSCIIGSLGWLAIAVAPHVSFLIIGRVLCGVSGSFSTPNCSLLVSQYRYYISILYLIHKGKKIGSFQFSQEEGNVPSAVWFNVWNWNSGLLLSWSSSILEVCGLSATAPLLPLGSGSLLPP